MQLSELLESTGFPVAYREFKQPPTIPYIVYYAEDDNNFAADNIVYHSSTNYTIELYSDKKDSVNESKIEAVLTANEIYYEKLEAWIDSEEMHQVSYSIQI